MVDPPGDRFSDRPGGRPTGNGRPATGSRPGGDADVVTVKNERDASASRLFDLRWLIGALFSFYGVVLIVASFFVGTEKSVGVDINLWLGLAMLLLGLFFAGWARVRPLRIEGESALARAERERTVREQGREPGRGPGS
jgi:hypothetical protein